MILSSSLLLDCKIMICLPCKRVSRRCNHQGPGKKQKLFGQRRDKDVLQCMRPVEEEQMLSYQEQGSIGSDPALSVSTWRKKIMGCLHFRSHVPVSPSMMDQWTHWISKGKTRPLPHQQGIFSKHQLWNQRFNIVLQGSQFEHQYIYTILWFSWSHFIEAFQPLCVCRLGRLIKAHYSKNGVGQNENPLVNGLQLTP